MGSVIVSLSKPMRALTPGQVCIVEGNLSIEVEYKQTKTFSFSISVPVIHQFKISFKNSTMHDLNQSLKKYTFGCHRRVYSLYIFCDCQYSVALLENGIQCTGCLICGT